MLIDNISRLTDLLGKSLIERFMINSEPYSIRDEERFIKSSGNNNPIILIMNSGSNL
jgi:hypothetical protein